MAYQVYFGVLEEENRALTMSILKLKEEADTLEPGEAALLYELRGSETPTPLPPEEQQSRQRQGGGGGGRRGSGRRGQRSQNNGGGGGGGAN